MDMDHPIITATSRNRRVFGTALAVMACVLAGCVPSQSAPPRTTAQRERAAVVPASAESAAPSSTRDVDAGAQARSTAELLEAALGAYKQGHLVAPATDNSTAYYLEVLRRDPQNRVARDALQESFPFASRQVERSIAQNDFDEAAREIELLARADPTNYTLTILRAKLAEASGESNSATGTMHVLTLRASTQSWIEVRGAHDRVLDSRVLRAGDSRTYRVAGATRVTLGNAGGIEVTRDGEHVPLVATRQNQVMHLTFFARG
jgi:hypothetical protein